MWNSTNGSMRCCITFGIQSAWPACQWRADEKIAEYLVYVATDRIGLQETKEHALVIAAILRDWKTTIDEKHAQSS